MKPFIPCSFTHVLSMEDGESCYFCFDPVYMMDGIKYLVTADDGKGHVTIFHMREERSSWRIVSAPQVDDRFLRMTNRLSSLIEAGVAA